MINFSADFHFSDISDLRLVDNCVKMTAYGVTGGYESKTVILKILKMINNLLLIFCLDCLCFNYSLIRRKLVFSVRKMKNFPETIERE